MVCVMVDTSRSSFFLISPAPTDARVFACSPRQWGRGRKTRKAFIVKFDTPDEAQRAIREKQAELWGTGKIHIVSYK